MIGRLSTKASMMWWADLKVLVADSSANCLLLIRQTAVYASMTTRRSQFWSHTWVTPEVTHLKTLPKLACSAMQGLSRGFQEGGGPAPEGQGFSLLASVMTGLVIMPGWPDRPLARRAQGDDPDDPLIDPFTAAMSDACSAPGKTQLCQVAPFQTLLITTPVLGLVHLMKQRCCASILGQRYSPL